MENGVALKKARLAKKWSQEKLAEEVYVARETLARWEAGRRPIPIYRRELKRLLDVDVE